MTESAVPPPEEHDYLELEGEQIYVVRHPAIEPVRGRVLLAGPFVPERPHSYVGLVRWARFLASRGLDCLRFDYRGANESTGRFEDQSFRTWLEDLECCARWYDETGIDAPLALHGHRLGGLLAARAFLEDGIGEALLMWSPPASGRKLLFDTLRRRLATDMALGGRDEPKTREEYVEDLLAGELVEVEGYPWSRRLWEDSESFDLELTGTEGTHAAGRDRPAPWRTVALPRSVGPLADPYGVNFQPRGGSRPKPLNPDLTELFEENLEWLVAAVEGRNSPS